MQIDIEYKGYYIDAEFDVDYTEPGFTHIMLTDYHVIDIELNDVELTPTFKIEIEDRLYEEISYCDAIHSPNDRRLWY